jgi:flagellar biosynthesis/type III secretory pathway protein FliH
MVVDVWTKRGLEQGLEQGLQQGLEQGLEKGLQQGLEKGRIEGIREDLLLLLQARFGPLSAEIKAKTESLTIERSREIMLATLEAKSLSELGLEQRK